MKTNDFSLLTSLMLLVSCAAWACDGENANDGAGGSAGAATGGQDDGSSTGGGAGGDSTQTGGNGGDEAGGAGGESNGSGGGGATPECYEAPSNLVYWWTADRFEVPGPGNFDKLQEVKAGHHAAINGSGWSLDESYIGLALTLDEETQAYAGSPSGPSNEVLDWPAASLEFWFSTETPSANLVSFFADWVPEDESWGVVLSGGKVRVTYAKGDLDGAGPDTAGTFELTSDDRFDDGEFHHVAVSNDVEEMEARLYVDGELVDSIDVSQEILAESPEYAQHLFSTVLRAFSQPLMFGGDDYQDEWLEGVVDEVSVYEGSLTAAQITGIHQAGSAGKCAPEAAAAK